MLHRWERATNKKHGVRSKTPKIDPRCHPERSEGASTATGKVPRYARDDNFAHGRGFIPEGPTRGGWLTNKKYGRAAKDARDRPSLSPRAQRGASTATGKVPRYARDDSFAHGRGFIPEGPTRSGWLTNKKYGRAAKEAQDRLSLSPRAQRGASMAIGKVPRYARDDSFAHGRGFIPEGPTRSGWLTNKKYGRAAKDAQDRPSLSPRAQRGASTATGKVPRYARDDSLAHGRGFIPEGPTRSGWLTNKKYGRAAKEAQDRPSLSPRAQRGASTATGKVPRYARHDSLAHDQGFIPEGPTRGG